jgi:translocation and assembly module TamB
MGRRRRLALYAGAGVAAVLLVLLAALLVLTNTDWGRERVRAFAVDRLNATVDGTVAVTRLDGNLLRRLTLVEASIVDAQGRPFLRADTIATRFSLRGLLRQQVRLTDLRLVNAVIVLDEPPGEDWNYVRIFRIEPDPERDPDRDPGWGDWVSLHDVWLVNTRILVQSAWAPPDGVTGAERERAIQRALGGETRDNIVAVDGGYQNVMDFRELHATFPVIVPAHPDSAGIPIQVSRFTGIVQPFKPPSARVEALAGRFNLERDTLHFSDVRADLPESRLGAAGSYSLKSGDLVLSLNAAPFAFNDMRWLYPQLPEQGGGPVRLYIAARTTATRIIAEDMDLAVREATLQGRVDVTLGDTLRLGDTRVRFARVGTDLIRRVAPDFTFPRAGVFTGRLAVEGPRHALALDGDVVFDDAAGPSSRVVAEGTLGIAPQLRFGPMNLEFRPLHAGLVRAFVPRFPVTGMITGQARLAGTPDLLDLQADLALEEPGVGRSRILADGRIDQRDELRLDNVVLRLAPLRTDLLAVNELPPGGTMVGRVRLSGVPQRALAIDGAVELTDPRTGTSSVAARGGLEFGDAFRVRDLFVRTDPLQLDLVRRWLPELPAGGTLAGEARLDGFPARGLLMDGEVELWDPQSGTSVFGATGRMAWGHQFRADDLTLRLHSVQVDLFRRYAPDLPPGGVLTGVVTLDGAPAHMLQVDGNLAHLDPRLGTSRVDLQGGIALGETVAFRSLDVRMDPLQMALVRGFAPDIPVGGVLAGRATLDGTPRRFSAVGNVVHNEAGRRSHLAGRVELATGPGGWAMADLRLQPLALATVGQFVPAAGLRGSVAGTLRARGRMDDLHLDADLRVADGGSITVSAWLDAAAARPAYRIQARTDAFDMAAVTAAAPATTALTGTIALDGQGTEPATMNARVAADLVELQVDDVAADRVLLHGRIDAGLATVDTAFVRLGTAEAQLHGSFGLVAGRTGTLAFQLRADSLHAFAGVLPGTRAGLETAPDATPTPALLAADTAVVDTAAFAVARQPVPPEPTLFPGGSREVHTITVADISPMVRAPEPLRADPVTGALPQAMQQPGHVAALPGADPLRPGAAPPGDTLLAPVPEPPADSIAGSLFARGTLSGNVQQFDARGRAEVDNLVLAGARVGEGEAAFVLRGAGTPHLDAELDAELHQVRAAGMAFDSIAVDASYRGQRAGEGRAVVVAHQDPDTDYRADFAFSLALDRSELRLADATLRFDTVTWQTTRPGLIAWGGGALEVRTLELESNLGGTLFVDGDLPLEGAGDFLLRVDNLELAQLATLLQQEEELSGRLDLEARVSGIQAAPAITGRAELRDARRNGTELPHVVAELDYANLQLAADARFLHEGRVMATADATLPVDLSITGAGPRLLDGPIAINLQADSLPADMLPALTDQVEEVRGRIVADVAVRGTFSQPLLDGTVNLDLGRARVVPLGVRFDDIAGTLRLDGSTIHLDSLVAWSGGPTRVQGQITLEDLASPLFDLALVADNSRIINTEDAELRVDADVAITGPLMALQVEGTVHARSGVIYIPELQELGSTNVVNLHDPGTFDRTGRALDHVRPTTPPRPEILANATISVGVTVDRDVWVRSTEANVEIYTPPEVGALRIVANGIGAPVVEGSINTDRGEYEFMGRRFRMTRGSVTFVGESPINPILQIAAEHEVRLPGREALIIRIVIGGTTDDLQINLESSAQPPISQTDLLSYLAFGRDASSLIQQQGSTLSGQGGAAGELVGNLAGLATQQLATIAMEAGVSEVEREVAREFALDMFRISPADMPAEVFTGGWQDVFRGTEIEAGRYLRPRLFLAAQARAGRPGLRLEYRTPRGYEWHAAWQPRFMPVEPTLLELSPRRRAVLGSFLFREWRF